jgi:imidazoleglycerol-phosphate dehydratase
VGDLSLEMFEHVLDSLVVNARTTVHVVQIVPSANLGDTVQAVAIAFGVALKHCAVVDCRRAGATASSKGTLSV